MAQQITDNFLLNAAKDLDDKKGVLKSGVWSPYDNVAEFLARFPNVNSRAEGQFFWVRSETDSNKADLYTVAKDKSTYKVQQDVDLSSYSTTAQMNTAISNAVSPVQEQVDEFGVDLIQEIDDREAGDQVNATAISNETDRAISSEEYLLDLINTKASADSISVPVHITYSDLVDNVYTNTFFSNQNVSLFYNDPNGEQRAYLQFNSEGELTMPIDADESFNADIISVVGNLNNVQDNIALLLGQSEFTYTVNLIDKSKIVDGKYYTTGTGAETNDPARGSIANVPVVVGDYTLSGYGGSPDVLAYAENGDYLGFLPKTNVAGGVKVTVEEGVAYVNINVYSGSMTGAKDTVMFAAGEFVLPYEPFKETILNVKNDRVKGEEEDTLSQDLQALYSLTNIVEGVNLIDKDKILDGKYYSPSTGLLSTDVNRGSIASILAIPGDYYTLSGYGGSPDVLAYEESGAFIGQISSTIISGGLKYLIPEDTSYVNINIYSGGASSSKDTVMFVKGEEVIPYVPYTGDQRFNDGQKTSGIKKATLSEDIDDLFSLTKEIDSINLIDKAKIVDGKYYSPTTGALSTDANRGSISNIPVEVGADYTLTGYSGATGVLAYRENGTYIREIPVLNLTGVLYVNIPEETSYVNINVYSGGASSAKDTVQFSKGLIPLAYHAYEEPTLLLNENKILEPEIDYELTQVTYRDIYKKFPNFANHWLKRDQDLCLVFIGTSLIARGLYAPALTLSQRQSRPPLADNDNVFTRMVDKLMWDGQVYRRYDYPGEFTETGTFSTSATNANWDDWNYREGYTRFSTSSNASTAFVVPTKAWVYNFIYRTDQQGTEQAQVSVAEGNGKMQAWSGTAWVEANGFVFSMKEPPATATKGNTTFQKRLKMRCRDQAKSFDSTASTKSVTISNLAGTGRFLYWGVEHSQRQYMLTLINAARGGHAFTGSLSLTKYEDNEVYSFDPNMIFLEMPIINEGGGNSGQLSVTSCQEMLDIMTTKILSSSATSYKTKTDGFTTAELFCITDTIGINGSVFNTDGSIKFIGEKGTSEMRCNFDYYQYIAQYFNNQDEVGFINTFIQWKKECDKRYGGVYFAMQPSGIAGSTLSVDGTHWNLNGVKVIAKYITPIFDFI